MALNLNVSPYYDDFDDTKNFNRVLFRPGYAVQARELTQLQTLLQSQIGKFGDHIFKNGSVVQGCEFKLDSERAFVKILDAGVDNNTLASYVGDTVTGATTGMTAVILDVATGTEAEQPNLKTLYLRYTGGDGESTAVHFGRSETLTVTSTVSGRNGDTFVVDDTYDEAEPTNSYWGLGCALTVDDGILYIDGKFVNHTAQTIILSKYSNLPTVKVGFQVVENTVSPEDDQTLLDPAQGSFNYAAPGADRYKVATTLVAYEPTDTIPPTFNQLVDIVNGEIQRTYTSNIYGELGKNLARRTYDESGNYAVRQFPVLIKEHLDVDGNNGLRPLNEVDPERGGSKDLLAVGLEAGKAYVRGFEHETFQTEYVVVPKGNTTVSVQELPISTAYGNYILVDEFCGLWDLNGGDRVSLRSVAESAITDGTFSTDTTAPGSEVGTARVKQIVYESGTAGTAAAQYRLYLYDIQMSSGDFKDVRGIFYDDATATGHADVVLDTNSNAVLQETSFNRSLFRFPSRATKTIAPNNVFDNSFIYTKEFDGELNASGQVTITLTGDETFPYDSFTSTIIKNNFTMVMKVAAEIVNTPSNIPLPKGSLVDISGATFTKPNSQTITIDIPGTLVAGSKAVKLYVNVQTANANPVEKVLREDRYVIINTNTHPSTSGGTYSLGLSDVYRIKNIFIGANTDTDAAVVAAGVDIASSFTLDSGQRDTEYRNAKIIKKPSAPSLVNKKLVIKLDYYTHDGAAADGTFFTVDSYPIDDTGATAATIKTQDIPVYVSPTTGESFDLRDTLDFRVRLTDTATNAASVGSATTNPTEGTSISAPSIGITNPVPTEQFVTDLEYYLGRTDRLIIDSEGIFSSIYGTPSLTPLTPAEPENAMSLAIITIPPYPSLAPNVAKSVNRPDYGVSFRTIDNRRYTMRDIGVLEQRINRLEYYTSLSLLEKAASDLSIPDGAGLDRFKNGILVDAFTGHNVGNVFDPAYHISIDPSKKEMRPFFYLENIDLAFDYANSTNVYKTGDLITLPYTNIMMTENPSASKPRNCVGELLFNYIGNMELDPPVDNWTDTSQQPDVSVNFDGNYDAWETMSDAWGTQWGDWQDVVTGRSAVGQSSQTVAGNTTLRGDTFLQQQTQVVTTTIEQRQTRQGVSLSVTPETQTQRTGARVTNTSIIPFMRSVTITFIAQRLKPNTRVYPFFDGVGVFAHCRPLSFDPATDIKPTDPAAFSSYAIAGATGAYGAPLVTNAQGVCVGQFRIPAGTFRTGDKNFRLCDDQFNRDAFITTSSTKTWSANGLSQNVQDTVISTRVANIELNTTSDSRSVFETQRTENRIADRTVGVVQTTVNNTFTTVNNITNIDNTVTNITNINNTNITNITQDPPIINTGPIVLPPPLPPPPPPPPGVTDPPPPPEPPVVPPIEIFEPETPTPDPCTPVVICTDEQEITISGLGGFGGLLNGSIETVTREATCATVNPCRPQVRGRDPIAQTFYVEGMPFGCYVTNLDIFFRTKSSSAPITLQLREVINGYPGDKVIPFGEVTLNPAAVNVSENATAATTFVFPSPVYLQNNTEYCFVLLPAGNNPDYNIWVSELGENELGTENRISEQPHIGVLFTSANNRSWTAWQKEDIKFTLRRADFEINTVGSLVMKNMDVDFLKFDSFYDGNFEAGDTVHGFSFNITNPGTGYTPGTIRHTLSGGGATTNGVVDVTISGGGAVTGVVVVAPGAGYTSNPTLTISSGSGSSAAVTVTLNKGFVKQYDSLYNVGKVLVTTGSFTAGDVVGTGPTYAEITEIENKQLNVLETNMGCIDHTPATISWSVAPTATGASVGGASFEGINFGQEYELTYEAQVYSYSNEQADLDGDKSLTVRAGLMTQTSTVSPVIDTRKCSIIAIANDINNVTTNEDGNNGSAASKYISRRVVLDDGQDAQDLKVYLSNKIPTGCGVHVYGRFQEATDASNFDDLNWIELELTNSPLDSTAKSGFVEYEYSIPTVSYFTVATGDVNISTNVITETAHGMTTGDPVVYMNAGGTEITGLTTQTIYYVNRVSDDTFKLYDTAANAITGGATGLIDLSGTGNSSQYFVTSTEGVYPSDEIYRYRNGNVLYSEYKSFAVKVVLTSSNSSVVPRVRELRAIALQV
jgi:hypothetical protein